MAALARDRRGGVAILFVFLTMGLFGFVALAIDTSMWYAARTRVQIAADAAARAGAYELLRVVVEPENIEASVRADAAMNGFTPEKGAKIDILTDIAAGTVEAQISVPATLNFAKLLLSSRPIISARAAAAAPQSPPPCLTILEASASKALEVVNAKVTSPACRLQVNSTASDALALSGRGASVKAAQICTPGAATGSGTSVAVEKCAALPDPLSAWEPPAVPNRCDRTNAVFSKLKGSTIPNAGLEVYCGGLTIDKSDLTFSPGIYVIKDGDLTISKSTLTGRGVAFLLVGNSTLQILTKSTLTLVAPTDGPMAGMIFAHARNAPVGLVHQLLDKTEVNYEGAVYLPLQDMIYDGKKTVSTNVPPFTTYIVRRLTIRDGAELELDNNYAASSVPVVGKIGAGVVLTK